VKTPTFGLEVAPKIAKADGDARWTEAAPVMPCTEALGASRVRTASSPPIREGTYSMRPAPPHLAT